MNIGDRISVVKLYSLDKKSSLKVGDTGVIKSITVIEEINFINVIFDKGKIIANEDLIINEVGTYPLWEKQVKLEAINESN